MKRSSIPLESEES